MRHTFLILCLVVPLASCQKSGSSGAPAESGLPDGVAPELPGPDSPCTQAPSTLMYESAVQFVLGGNGSFQPTFDGCPDLFVIDPPLPPGLDLDLATGRIHGISNSPQGALDYEVTASNSEGQTSVVIQISVSPPVIVFGGAPTLTYDPVDADSATSIAVGDLDGDGLMETLHATDRGVFRRQGPERRPRRVTRSVYRLIEVADFDGDGNLDLIGAAGDRVSLEFGRGDGTTSYAVSVLTDPVQDLVVRDFDGDGNLDVFVATVGQDLMLLGDRAGRWLVRPIGAVGDTAEAAAADLDLDGDDDLVRIEEGEIYLLENLGGARFQDRGAIGLGTTLAVDDRDQDGDLDLLVVDTGALVEILQVRPWVFAAPADLGMDLDRFVLVDLDEAGGLDVVASGIGGVSVALDGPAGFATVQVFELFPTLMTVGDLDGDGDVDVAICGRGSAGLLLGSVRQSSSE